MRVAAGCPDDILLGGFILKQNGQDGSDREFVHLNQIRQHFIAYPLLSFRDDVSARARKPAISTMSISKDTSIFNGSSLNHKGVRACEPLENHSKSSVLPFRTNKCALADACHLLHLPIALA